MLRKTWRENFFVLVPQVFISRAKTKNFTRVFFRIYEPQSRHFRFENQVSNKPRTSIAPLCNSKSVTAGSSGSKKLFSCYRSRTESLCRAIGTSPSRPVRDRGLSANRTFASVIMTDEEVLNTRQTVIVILKGINPNGAAR